MSSSQPYRVHTLELNPHSVGRWQHTDCIFATPREGLGVIVPEAIKGGLTGLPKFMRDWEFISATEEETHHLGCNGMNIDHNVTVVGAEHTRLNEELDKHNVEVVPVQYDKVSARGGRGSVFMPSAPTHAEANLTPVVQLVTERLLWAMSSPVALIPRIVGLAVVDALGLLANAAREGIKHGCGTRNGRKSGHWAGAVPTICEPRR